MGFGVVDGRGDAGENLVSFFTFVGAAERGVEPVRAVDERIIAFRKIAGVAEVNGSLGEVALEVESETKMVVDVEVGGVQVYGVLKVFLGLDELAQTQFTVPALEEQVSILGVFGKGFGVGLYGFLVLTAAGLGLREGEVLGG